MARELFQSEKAKVEEFLGELSQSARAEMEVILGELSQSEKDEMEAILGPNSEPFEIFISDLMAKEPHAEKILTRIKKMYPKSLAVKLADFLGSSHNIDLREKCADLLCNMLLEDRSIRRNLRVSTQSNIRNLLKESTSLLYQCVASSSSKLKVSAFRIFCLLAEDVGETMVPCIEDLHSLFLKTLNNDTLDLRVRLVATIAVIRFIQCLSSSNVKERFQDLLPGMLRSLTDISCNSEGYSTKEVVELFIELAKKELRFLRRQLVDVVDSLLVIAEDKKLEDKTRCLVVEFVLSLVEAKEKAPDMIYKLPSFINTCIAIILKLLLDIKDKSSWDIADENTGKTCFYRSGGVLLRQFAMALGGTTISPIAIEQLDAYLVAAEWEKRHAALTLLVQIAIHSSKVMIEYLEQLVIMVLRSFQDPHPRVRWVAINAIYQLSTDFSPDLVEQYHNEVLPVLAEAMDDFQSPRMKTLAASTFLLFCGPEMQETLVSHLDGLLNKLLVLLKSDNEMVQEAAINAFTAIAKLSKEHIEKNYDFSMPYLKTILANANDKSNLMLRDDALECISIIAMVVGKEKFRDDLKQVMEVVKSIQQSHVEEFNTVVCYLEACCRICMCMGKEFLPYISIVMPPLIECVQLELNETVSSDELEDSIKHEVKFGDEIICTTGRRLLQAKSVACNLLALNAYELEEDFYPWISEAAPILAPSLKFYVDIDVRKNASTALGSLVRSAELAVEKGTAQGGHQSHFKQLCCDTITAFVDALHSEPDTEVCAIIMLALNECLEICGPLLNEDQVPSIIDGIKHVITESSRKRGELTEREKSEGFDAELLMEEIEQVEKVFSRVGDILSTLIKTFRAAFLPFLDELSPYLMPMMGEDKTAAERSTCFFIFNELMENFGEAALKYYNMYLPFLLESSNDKNPDVRQNTLYGLRLCAEYGGSVFKPFVEEALSKINVVITHFDACEPEDVEAYESAVSALGKICQFHRESIDSAQIIPSWLNCLPIKEDTVEAKVVHGQLCSMVERSDRELLGPNYMHLPKVISVFIEGKEKDSRKLRLLVQCYVTRILQKCFRCVREPAFFGEFEQHGIDVLCGGEDLVTEETAKRMINLLRHFQQTLAPTTLARARSLLLPCQEMALESILSSEE